MKTDTNQSKPRLQDLPLATSLEVILDDATTPSKPRRGRKATPVIDRLERATEQLALIVDTVRAIEAGVPADDVRGEIT